ncbi:MAG: hydroxyacid dehydrogenase [Acidimicrobiales bacterium]|nr:hydroxyacid dehydrogenase [Acidimicrobiia bacterium]NNC80082.1 hydroxyacid dehydrogenase [Acidimicrobiales bacterium]RZV48214.1 MAG: hydroxyacid dehydrogenase [Acidimicrobiales bacterium]
MTAIWFVREVSPELAEALADPPLGLGPLTAVGPALEDRVHAAGILAGGEPYSAEVLDSLPNLRVLSRIGIGYDAVDLAAATERGILVTNTPDGPTTSTAEHTIALMMAVAHELKPSAERLRDATGDYVSLQNSMELRDRVLGLVGYGRIGRRVAAMAEAIGMRVLISDPALDDSVPLDEVLSSSDVVSLHAPATSSTIGMIDASALARMKPGSILINCARGPIVNTDDLLAALESGHLMGAGLDVTEPEPLPADHPLLHMPNVIVTPHIASNTVAGRARMERMAFEQMTLGLSGQRPTKLLNADVWKG